MADRPPDVTEAVGSPLSTRCLGPWADFAPPWRAFLARRVPAGVEPDDLQEVFLRVVRHLGTLRGTERPEAWLFQIARNALWTSCARAGAETGAQIRSMLTFRARRNRRSAAEAELAPCLTAMIGRLDEPYRTAIDLTSLRALTG